MRVPEWRPALTAARSPTPWPVSQVLVRLHDPAGQDDDAHTRAALASLQASGVAYPSGTTFRGHAAIRLSVANWATDADDVKQTVSALAFAHGEAA